jgi:hypothetical protein
MPYGSEWQLDEGSTIGPMIDAGEDCGTVECIQNAVFGSVGGENVYVFIDRNAAMFDEAQQSENISPLRLTDDGLVGLMTLGK